MPNNGIEWSLEGTYTQDAVVSIHVSDISTAPQYQVRYHGVNSSRTCQGHEWGTASSSVAVSVGVRLNSGLITCMPQVSETATSYLKRQTLEMCRI